MNENNFQRCAIASIVIALLVLSTISGWAIMRYLEDDNTVDSFIISGTYSYDDSTYECTGTAYYTDLKESTRDYIYQFTFHISYIDDEGITNETDISSILDIVKSTEKPNSTLFHYLGTETLNEITISKWMLIDDTNGYFTYYLSGSNIFEVDIESEGFVLEAINISYSF